MLTLFNFILLFASISTINPLVASLKISNSHSTPLRTQEDSCLELLSESTEPVFVIEKPFLPVRKGWIGTTGTIFGDNPYFCNSFAFVQLDYLPPLPTQCDLFSPMLSFRYLLANKKEQGFSIGGGARYYSLPLCSILGFNVFYDFKSMPCNDFYQIGLGFEYLRFLDCISLLELRTNVYLPLKRHFVVKARYCYYPENYIAIGKNRFCNSGGLEISVGKRFFYKNFFDLYFSIAPYYLFNQHYGIQYNGVFRWKSIAYAGIQFYQNIPCSITDIAGIIGISIPLDSNHICQKNIPLRIPISRWETLKLQSCIDWKTNY